MSEAADLPPFGDKWETRVDENSETRSTSRKQCHLAKLDMFLNLSPQNQKQNGAGSPTATPANATTLFPHPYPGASYIFGAKSGNPNPAKLRSVIPAARPLAA